MKEWHPKIALEAKQVASSRSSELVELGGFPTLEAVLSKLLSLVSSAFSSPLILFSSSSHSSPLQTQNTHKERGSHVLLYRHHPTPPPQHHRRRRRQIQWQQGTLFSPHVKDSIFSGIHPQAPTRVCRCCQAQCAAPIRRRFGLRGCQGEEEECHCFHQSGNYSFALKVCFFHSSVKVWFAMHGWNRRELDFRNLVIFCVEMFVWFEVLDSWDLRGVNWAQSRCLIRISNQNSNLGLICFECNVSSTANFVACI